MIALPDNDTSILEKFKRNVSSCFGSEYDDGTQVLFDFSRTSHWWRECSNDFRDDTTYLDTLKWEINLSMGLWSKDTSHDSFPQNDKEL